MSLAEDNAKLIWGVSTSGIVVPRACGCCELWSQAIGANCEEGHEGRSNQLHKGDKSASAQASVLCSLAQEALWSHS